MAAITDVEQTLLDQLLDQFKHSPNILALLGILADPLQDTVDVSEFILDYTDLDDCTGSMLDMFGGLIGVTRSRVQEDDANIFRVCELGEYGDGDKRTGFADDTDATVTTGGFLMSLQGCPDQSDANAVLTDAQYRRLIKQKAQAFRSKMTHTNLFNYLLAFGSRCKVSSATHHYVDMDPVDYYGAHALKDSERYHTETKGFKPSGMNVEFKGNLRKDEL